MKKFIHSHPKNKGLQTADKQWSSNIPLRAPRSLGRVSFIFVIISLVAVLLIGLFIFLITFDANRYKGPIIEKIEDAIHKDVMIGNISLDIFPRLGLRMDGVLVKDIDKDWREPLLKVASVETIIKILPLFKRELQVRELRIKGLELTIYNKSLPVIPALKDTKASVLNSDPLPRSTLNFLVDRVTVSDSRITFVGFGRPSVSVHLDIIEAFVKNISLYGPVYINIRGSVFGNGVENIRLKGTLYPEIYTKKPYLRNVKLEINLNKLNPASFLKEIGLNETSSRFRVNAISGKLAVDSERLTLDPEDIYNSSISVEITNGNIDIPSIVGGLEHIKLDGILTGGNLDIPIFTGGLANGKFFVSGKIEDIILRRLWSFDVKLQNINIVQLLSEPDTDQPHLEGYLDMRIKASTVGFNPEEIINKLSLSGNIKLDRVVLKNMNLLAVALDKLNMFPGLTQRLRDRLPRHYSELLKQNYTAFKPFEARFNLNKKTLFFPELIIVSDAFYLKGRGAVGLDKTLNLRSGLFIPEDLSAAFIDIVRGLKYLQNPEGQITMPVDIVGKIPQISVRPDLEYVVRRLAVSKGQELFKSIFEKKKESQKEGKTDSNMESEEEETPVQQREKTISPEEVIIKGIFDILSGNRK